MVGSVVSPGPTGSARIAGGRLQTCGRAVHGSAPRAYAQIQAHNTPPPRSGSSLLPMPPRSTTAAMRWRTAAICTGRSVPTTAPSSRRTSNRRCVAMRSTTGISSPVNFRRNKRSRSPRRRTNSRRPRINRTANHKTTSPRRVPALPGPRPLLPMRIATRRRRRRRRNLRRLKINPAKINARRPMTRPRRARNRAKSVTHLLRTLRRKPTRNNRQTRGGKESRPCRVRRATPGSRPPMSKPLASRRGHKLSSNSRSSSGCVRFR